MNGTPTRVLLVEEDPTDAGLIQAALTGVDDDSFRVEWVTRLADALERLSRQGIEVILLDLTLPDRQGLEAFAQVLQAAPKAMILVLCSAREEETARQAVQRGAHDYLVKGHLDAHWLSRTLRYVMGRKAAHDAVKGSEARFRAMSDASPLGILVSDAEGNCVYTNAAYQAISGLTFEQTLNTSWSKAIHPEDCQRVLTEWRDAARGHAPFRTECRFQREDGSVVWTRVNSAAMGEAGMESHGHVHTFEDISARKARERELRAAEEALFEERERAQVTLNSIGDAVVSTDPLGNVSYLNVAAETMTGWSREDALGRPLAEVFRIIDGTTRQPAQNPAQRAIDEDQTVGLAADCVLVRRDGFESTIEDSAAPIHSRDGRVSGAVIVFHDVSQSRAMMLKMTHLAHHDFLTGLPNRALLTKRLSQAIGLAHRHRKRAALLFLDLDGFKHINDLLGHRIGDQLLQSVAACLVGCVRATDTVFRQGGDEFVILLAEIDKPQDAVHVMEKVRVALAVPHVIDGQELHVTSSIGVSLYPDDGCDVTNVMQNADTAMYHAKAKGRDNYQFFSADMNIRAMRRLAVEGSLRRALKEGEFILHYQPQIELASGVITGTEALIRWLDPDLGLICPKQFVPIAEECGLIVPIGRWVLREACGQVRAWLDAGLRAVPVAVNVSALEFRHRRFLEGVAQILDETGLPPRYLELELTESTFMHDIDSSASVLEALSAMGVGIAIDDFGSGYSSLGYLKRFPIGTLKIDQSFVRDIATDADDATIVGAVIAMGRNLRKRVIAEGVETQEQLVFLRAQHCDGGQGFRFSHPLSSTDFARLLAAGHDELPEGRPG
jgi:diguanylate cyclase (GGDEF)-like protein/PAS domain S-box-containing protein